MISEHELELALQLQKEIRDLKLIIVKLEEAKVSRNQSMNSGISVDSNKIEVDDYTQNLLQKFKDDLVHVHKVKLQDLIDRYAEIIESPEDALVRIIRNDG